MINSKRADVSTDNINDDLKSFASIKEKFIKFKNSIFNDQKKDCCVPIFNNWVYCFSHNIILGLLQSNVVADLTKQIHQNNSMIPTNLLLQL